MYHPIYSHVTLQHHMQISSFNSIYQNRFVDYDMI